MLGVGTHERYKRFNSLMKGEGVSTTNVLLSANGTNQIVDSSILGQDSANTIQKDGYLGVDRPFFDIHRFVIRAFDVRMFLQGNLSYAQEI